MRWGGGTGLPRVKVRKGPICREFKAIIKTVKSGSAFYHHDVMVILYINDKILLPEEKDHSHPLPQRITHLYYTVNKQRTLIQLSFGLVW